VKIILASGLFEWISREITTKKKKPLEKRKRLALGSSHYDDDAD